MKTWEYGKLNNKFYITDSKLDIDIINKYLFILDLMLSDMNDITLNDMLEKPKYVLFEEYKNKCITTIDSCMSHCDLKEKATFELMKEQIKSKTYKKESFNDDILKLSELNYTIKNQ